MLVGLALSAATDRQFLAYLDKTVPVPVRMVPLLGRYIQAGVIKRSLVILNAIDLNLQRQGEQTPLAGSHIVVNHRRVKIGQIYGRIPIQIRRQIGDDSVDGPQLMIRAVEFKDIRRLTSGHPSEHLLVLRSRAGRSPR